MILNKATRRRQISIHEQKAEETRTRRVSQSAKQKRNSKVQYAYSANHEGQFCDIFGDLGNYLVKNKSKHIIVRFREYKNSKDFFDMQKS